MQEYKFDLQLFSEGEVAPSAPAQPAEAAPTTEEQPKVIEFNTLSQKEQADFFEQQYHKPKEPTPIVKLIEPVAEPEAKPVEIMPVEPVTPAVEVYTPEEIATTGIEKLDPARLPEELKPYYKSMLADYTRKTQAIAEQKKQVEQQPQVEQKTKTYDRLKQEYAQDLQATVQILNEGNTGEPIEYNPYDPDHAYIMKRVSDYRVYNEQQQQSVVSQGQRVIQQAQADPEFQNIYAHAEKELVTLAGSSMQGFEMASKIMQANSRLGTPNATAEDIELIQTFWANSKTKYKQAKTKPVIPQALPPKMPVATEQTGVSVSTEAKPKKFNPKQAANMDKNQLSQLMGVFATK